MMMNANKDGMVRFMATPGERITLVVAGQLDDEAKLVGVLCNDAAPTTAPVGGVRSAHEGVIDAVVPLGRPSPPPAGFVAGGSFAVTASVQTTCDPCPVCDVALPAPRGINHHIQRCACGYSRYMRDGDPKHYDGHDSEALFDGLTPQECLLRYVQQQQQEGDPSQRLTERQRRMAQLMWRADLRAKVAAHGRRYGE